MKAKTLILVILLCASFITFSQKATKPEGITENFFKTWHTMGMRKGAEVLKKQFNPVIADSLSKKLSIELAKIDEKFEFSDWVYLSGVLLAQHLSMQIVIVKYEDKPYRVNLMFYNRNATWYVQDISVEVNPFEDMEKAVRAKRFLYTER